MERLGQLIVVTIAFRMGASEANNPRYLHSAYRSRIRSLGDFTFMLSGNNSFRVTRYLP